jgi:type VI secretion system secreted protein Hcp
MPIYMQYDNGAITGDVTEEHHKDWIELSSAQFGIGRGITSPTPGGSKDREASDPSVSEVVVTKIMDNASADLFKESLKGVGKQCVIEFCVSTQEQGMQPYLTWTLTNTMISGNSMSSGGDRPNESLSLNFTKIEYKNIPRDEAHAEQGQKIYTYDLATAKVS